MVPRLTKNIIYHGTIELLTPWQTIIATVKSVLLSNGTTVNKRLSNRLSENRINRQNPYVAIGSNYWSGVYLKLNRENVVPPFILLR